MAAEVSELDVQTHPAYPSRQPENVVYYVQPQNFYQPPEPYRGVRDVMISTSNVVQKRATNQIPNLSSYQIQNQTHQNFWLAKFPNPILLLHIPIFSCFL